jgi:23S rRNA (guanosine2251-2'-O)-methyltransferase
VSPAHDIICGTHAARLVLMQAPETVLEIWIQENKRNSKSITQLTSLAGTIPVQYVSKGTLDKLAQYGRHQGIVMKRRRSKPAIQDISDLIRETGNALPLLLVLDGIQDPHNLGACLRTADAAGVQAVILPRDRAAGITPAVSKVASGAAENIPVIQVSNLVRALRQLQAAGIWIIGAAVSAHTSIYEIDLDRPLALVMGAEGKGLRQNTSQHCDILVNIPMAGIVESLNISVATGICLFETVRQRQLSP